MPNWVSNHLIIEGPALERAHFRTHMAGTRLDFAHDPADPMFPGEDGPPDVVPLAFDAGAPVPTIVREAPYDPTGYEWQSANWGTKWDLSVNTACEETDASLQYRFDTAWSPPQIWLATVARQYPTLRFALHFLEEGNQAQGSLLVSEGGVTSVVEMATPSDQAKHGLLHFDTDPTARDDDGEMIDSEYAPAEVTGTVFTTPLPALDGPLAGLANAASPRGVLVAAAGIARALVATPTATPAPVRAWMLWDLVAKHASHLSPNLIDRIVAAGPAVQGLGWRRDLVGPTRLRAEQWLLDTLGDSREPATPSAPRRPWQTTVTDPIALRDSMERRIARCLAHRWITAGTLSARFTSRALPRLRAAIAANDETAFVTLGETIVQRPDCPDRALRALVDALSDLQDGPALAGLILLHPMASPATQTAALPIAPLIAQHRLVARGGSDAAVRNRIFALAVARAKGVLRRMAAGKTDRQRLPGTLALLAADADPQQYRETVKLLGALGSHSVLSVLKAGTPTQRAAVTPDDVAGLLTSDSTAVRQEIILLLGMNATEPEAPRAAVAAPPPRRRRVR